MVLLKLQSLTRAFCFPPPQGIQNIFIKLFYSILTINCFINDELSSSPLLPTSLRGFERLSVQMAL